MKTHAAGFAITAGLLAVVVNGCSSSPTPANHSGRTGIVTMRGSPLTLEGAGVRVGAQAPDFQAIATDMSAKRLSDYRGQVVILSTVPSLDTAVCDHETRTFNEKAAALPSRVVVLTVSMDLPFAQKRWCGAHGIESVVTLSDFKTREVGDRYGLRLRESGLLTRAVLVIDGEGVIRYQEIVSDVSKEPDYDAALNAARSAASGS